MRKYYRLLCAIVTISLLLSLFVACDSGNTETEATSAITTTEDLSFITEPETIVSETKTTVTETETTVTETTVTETETTVTETETTVTETTVTETETTVTVTETTVTETTVTETETTVTETETFAAESTEETSTETETIETEIVEDVISFIDYTRSSGRGLANLKTGGDMAISFTIPDGQVKKLYLNLTDKSNYTACNFFVNIYYFDGKYEQSVLTEPIYSQNITSTLRTYTLTFEDGLIGPGSYLVVVSYADPVAETEADPAALLADGEDIDSSENTLETEISDNSESSDETDPETDPENDGDTDGETSIETDGENDTSEETSETTTTEITTTETETELYCMVVKDIFWTNKTLPEGYDQFVLRSYIDGEITKKAAICGGMVVEHGVIKEETETEAPVTDKDKGENVVKVILLGGQSNATGASSVSHLMRNVSDSKYQEYVRGYDNVKILYTNGSCSGGFHTTTVVNEFVNVKAGQGYNIAGGNFGPELGLAAYLSQEYPDETFYIIKYAIGGSSLQGHWNPTDDTRAQCLNEFYDKVDLGLSLLEDEGFDPRIVAFLWMQGESDASTFRNARLYYDLQKTLVEDIRKKYAFYASVRDIAFIDAAICDSGFWASWFLLNDMKLEYSKESWRNYFIDTVAYGLSVFEENNDLAHYDSLDMLLLGELFGEKVSEAID